MEILQLTVSVSEDAMNEVAWCYLEGFGCKKDKVSSLLPVSQHARVIDHLPSLP